MSQMKEVKKLQKQEEKHRKEAERESQRSLLKYALRTQTILNLIDDNAKETLQSGEGEDAVKLNESELNQLDEFYELVNPTRPGNERYVMRYYRRISNIGGCACISTGKKCAPISEDALINEGRFFASICASVITNSGCGS